MNLKKEIFYPKLNDDEIFPKYKENNYQDNKDLSPPKILTLKMLKRRYMEPLGNLTLNIKML